MTSSGNRFSQGSGPPTQRQRYHATRQLRLWRKRRREGLRRVVLIGLLAMLTLFLITTPALAAGTVGPLPAVGGLSTNNLHQDMLIYDRHGILLADIGDHGDHRIVVPLGDISPLVIRATIDIEDHTFYSNSGIDLASIARAAIADYTHHHIDQGGSTITQQLVKQVFIGPNPPPTIQRKLKEAVLALEVNGRYNKNDVLSMYLNTIYYGSQSYGIEAAARDLFHTSANRLDLAEASMLAGLPQAPTSNSPLLNPVHAKVRQAEVLQAMVSYHDITEAQAEAALKEPLQVYPASNDILAPHFVDYVLQTLEKQFHITPSQHKGWRITTSLDANLQKLAQGIVTNQIAYDGAYYNFHQGALVAMDPKTGEVLAMVGGANYYKNGGQINMAVSPRQPGSSFKMFTYTAAIESQKVNMITPIYDQPLIFPIYGGNDGTKPYAPQNYDLRFHGTLPLKMAMGNSLNIPALKTELYVGIPAVLDTARRMGVTTLISPDAFYGPSLTLGGYAVPPIDMATGAATLATMGVRHRAAPILKIEDGLGNVQYTYDASKNVFRAVSPQVAYILASIMSDDRNRCMEFGCGGDLTLPGRLVAAKTGTTQDFRDNWTVGFTPQLATAVWVGNPDNTPLSHNSTGIVGAAPIWHQFMMRALSGQPAEWYAQPDGLDRIGDNVFLPGTENRMFTLLDRPWPVCRFRGYDPYTLTTDQLLIDGVPCVLGYVPRGLSQGSTSG